LTAYLSIATEIWVVALLQAWEYAKAVGRMSVQFDAAGHVVSCSGRVTLPIPKNSQILSNIVGTPVVTKHTVQVRKLVSVNPAQVNHGIALSTSATSL
jgi:hypothetical protein